MSAKFNSIVDVRGHVLSCLTSRKFIDSRGLASQLPIFIAAHEPFETEDSSNLPNWLVQQAMLVGVRVARIDVFSELVHSISEQGLLASVVQQEKAKVLSKKQVASGIRSAADLSTRLPAKIRSVIESEKPNAILISGFGAAYPFFRVSELVGILEEMQMQIPAVLLFPGSFVNTVKSPVLKLFGEFEESHNYRALDLFSYEA